MSDTPEERKGREWVDCEHGGSWVCRQCRDSAEAAAREEERERCASLPCHPSPMPDGRAVLSRAQQVAYNMGWHDYSAAIRALAGEEGEG